MLYSFKPGPRFAIRSVGSLSNTDVSALRWFRWLPLTLSASSPGARTCNLWCMPQYPRDGTALDYSMPHHLRLGTAGFRGTRERRDRPASRGVREDACMADYLDRQCAQNRMGLVSESLVPFFACGSRIRA